MSEEQDNKVEQQTDDEEAKKKAREEARAARLKARAEKKAKEEAEAAQVPKEPSPNQPKLDRIVQIIKEQVSEAAIEEAEINELDRHIPTVVVKNEYWPQVAEQLRDHSELQLNYLRNVSGVDHETHFEVVYHMLSLQDKVDYCFKVKTDREAPSIHSITGIWETANWNEREIFDLLGIDFPGHPNMEKIMMTDDWIGHPLRKDYEPYDPEV